MSANEQNGLRIVSHCTLQDAGCKLILENNSEHFRRHLFTHMITIHLLYCTNNAIITSAWQVFRLQAQETASIYGGEPTT